MKRMFGLFLALALLTGLIPFAGAEGQSGNAQKPPKVLSGDVCEIEIDDCTTVIITEFLDDARSISCKAFLTSGDITLRVKIGEEVDERSAFIGNGDADLTLADLEFDETGYLYRTKIEDYADRQEFPGTTFYACASESDKENGVMAKLTCFTSEAELDAYAEMNTEKSRSDGMHEYRMKWEYAEDAPAKELNGKAEYRFTIKSETGEPVSGAMIQICDLTTCQMAVTDENGTAANLSRPYPYEIHLLKVPDGYAPDDRTYIMPAEGGELTIALKKQ